MQIVLGQTGRVGREFSETPLRIDVLSSDLYKFLQRATCVVNLAAYTDVDRAEKNKQQAFNVNETGARNVAILCAGTRIPLIHVSTDYVFDGRAGVPYAEDAVTNPINVYGASKRAGETAILKVCPTATILRTAWVFGKYKPSFPEAILKKLLTTSEAISVVSDQIGNPTRAKDLAEFIKEFSRAARPGIFHVTNSGFCSRFELAKHLVEVASQKTHIPTLDSSRIVPVLTKDLLARPAKRPHNTALKSSFKLRPWQEAVEEHVDDLIQQGFFDSSSHA